MEGSESGFKPVLDEARLEEGDYLEIEASEGQIRLRRVASTRQSRPTLAELVSQITAENRYQELSPGGEVGREKIEW